MELLKRLTGVFRSAPREVNLGRNDECWCGSGKKYKRCHLDADQYRLQSRSNR